MSITRILSSPSVGSRTGPGSTSCPDWTSLNMPRFTSNSSAKFPQKSGRRTARNSGGLVVYFINTHTFVAPNLALGEAQGRECIRSDTRPTEQRSHGPNSAQPIGRHVFWAEASWLAPYRSTVGYARRSRLASAQNPLPRKCEYLGNSPLSSG